MSFTTYLEVCRAGDNPAGDFIRDARDDRGMRDFAAWDELRRHLAGKMAQGFQLKAGTPASPARCGGVSVKRLRGDPAARSASD